MNEFETLSIYAKFSDITLTALELEKATVVCNVCRRPLPGSKLSYVTAEIEVSDTELNEFTKHSAYIYMQDTAYAHRIIAGGCHDHLINTRQRKCVFLQCLHYIP